MKRWYQAMCVVKLGVITDLKDGTGENSAVTGYAINIGVSGTDLMQAMMEAERIALSTFAGKRDGNRLEEVNIKEADVKTLREQLQIEERGGNGELVYRSKLIYFDE